MSPERWQQIERLYFAALERVPDEREAFLESACASDEDLRREVESLIAIGNRVGAFMELPVNGSDIMGLQPQPSMVGRVLGRYRLISLLAKGGMGHVYLGEDTTLRRKVAVKLLPQEFTFNRERLQRLKQEARAASALNHPNIITIYEIGQLEQTHYLVTEYIEGETLRAQLERGQLSIEEVLDIAVQVVSALGAAHAAGITHRDIKPENLIVRPDGLVKVVDFGLAKLAEESTPADEDSARGTESTIAARMNTAPGIVLGTISYMSPEQVRGLPVDHRSDIFSLGVTLYELVTEQRPFTGATASDVIAEILRSEPLPINDLKPGLLPELVETISRMLAKKPEDRQQNASELLIELQGVARRCVDAEESTRNLVVGSRHLRNSVQSALTENAVSHQPINFKWVYFAAVFIVLFSSMAGLFLFRQRARSSEQRIHSLVVLPFINSSADPNAEYLGDGITESLIDTLSQLPQLKVTARTTSFRYKGRDIEPSVIARDLQVDAIVTGRVTRQGDALVIQADLLDTTDGSQLWGERYSRRLADIFTLQEQIAQEIAEKLRLRLTNEEKRGLSRRYTSDITAYQDYLQGQQYAQRRTREDVLAAIDYYQKAIQEDNNYALAYAGLTDAYTQLTTRIYIAPREGRQKAREAAIKALSLDPNLAEAHAAVGETYIFFAPYDFATGDRELHRAIELSPSLALAHHFLGVSMLEQGRRDEALQEVLRARELDPLAPTIGRNLANYYYLSRDYPRALETLRKSFELGPPFVLAPEIEIYLHNGLANDAASELERVKPNRVNETLLIFYAGMIDAAEGKRLDALQIIKELEKSSGPDLRTAPWIARIYVTLNEKELALSWLERGFEANSIALFYKDAPIWDPIRGDARFADLVKRMGAST